VVTGVAGKNEMAAVLKFDGGSFSLYCIRWLKKNHAHGHTHFFIPCNGDSQRGTGNKTDEQHHPKKRHPI
jgi:hypothetical protein